MRLYQQGKLSEVEANDIWGIYGYYLSWRFDRHADGVRVAAPSLATIKHSSRPLTHGQAEGLRFLNPLVALDREHRLGFDACEGMALSRLGHWLSA